MTIAAVRLRTRAILQCAGIGCGCAVDRFFPVFGIIGVPYGTINEYMLLWVNIL
jgi:hypothetical protein